MKTLIVGGIGFVESPLTPFLVEKRFDVTIMARRPDHGPKLSSQEKMLTADATKPGEWQDQGQAFDLFINLAGVSVFKRWDEAYKKRLRDTRILTCAPLGESDPLGC